MKSNDTLLYAMYTCMFFFLEVIFSSESDNDDIDACENNAADDESTRADAQAIAVTDASESNAKKHEKFSFR